MCVFLVYMFWHDVFAQTEQVVKAAFIEKITRFIDWPESADIQDRSKPFVIGVIGVTPLQPHLEQLARLTTIKGKPVTIRRITTYEKPPDVDMCFISSSEDRHLAEILEAMQGRPVLTVGDTLNFGRSGVMVNFFVERDALRFEINLEVARQEGFEISGRILKLARIVGADRNLR